MQNLLMLDNIETIVTMPKLQFFHTFSTIFEKDRIEHGSIKTIYNTETILCLNLVHTGLSKVYTILNMRDSKIRGSFGLDTAPPQLKYII